MSSPKFKTGDKVKSKWGESGLVAMVREGIYNPNKVEDNLYTINLDNGIAGYFFEENLELVEATKKPVFKVGDKVKSLIDLHDHPTGSTGKVVAVATTYCDVQFCSASYTRYMMYFCDIELIPTAKLRVFPFGTTVQIADPDSRYDGCFAAVMEDNHADPSIYKVKTICRTEKTVELIYPESSLRAALPIGSHVRFKNTSLRYPGVKVKIVGYDGICCVVQHECGTTTNEVHGWLEAIPPKETPKPKFAVGDKVKIQTDSDSRLNGETGKILPYELRGYLVDLGDYFGKLVFAERELLPVPPEPVKQEAKVLWAVFVRKTGCSVSEFAGTHDTSYRAISHAKGILRPWLMVDKSRSYDSTKNWVDSENPVIAFITKDFVIWTQSLKVGDKFPVTL